jgi:hypothetical protein
MNLKESIENTMKETHYKSFDQWVQNFALNLPNIWNESSAKEICQITSEYDQKSSAIVIGRGPSIDKHKHLKVLAESDYKGNIICCDGKLVDALNAGVTPTKFPKFFVTSIEPYSGIRKHYDDPIIDKYGDQIKGVFSVLTDPSVVDRARKSRIKIHWMHSLFDYNEGKKSFNHISALMVRAKNHSNGLPAIQTGGNVGTSSWFVGWKILKCSTVTLIGLNHGWEEDDSWEKIISHGNYYDSSKGVDRNSPTFKKLFKKIYNPDFGCYCILDPLFQFYSTAFKEFISRSPNWLTTINATEGGSIFGDKIHGMKFKEFLKKYSN